jgi:myosin heavy chain 6/7
LKKIQITVTELQTQVEDEQRQRDEAREAAASAERRANLIVGELEELRTALEQAERARKAAENELNDAADRISELSTHNANLSSQKRQLESTVAAMQADLDEAVAELKNSEERSKKAGKFLSLNQRIFYVKIIFNLASDAARLAEELRQEQEHAIQVERLRKGLEQQIKDLQTRLDEAEANALKGGKRIIAKLEQRVCEKKKREKEKKT